MHSDVIEAGSHSNLLLMRVSLLVIKPRLRSCKAYFQFHPQSSLLVASVDQPEMGKVTSLWVFFFLLQTALTVMSAPIDTLPFATSSGADKRSTEDDWTNDMLSMRTLFGKRDASEQELFQIARRSAEEKLLNDLEGLLAQQNTKGKPLRFSFKG